MFGGLYCTRATCHLRGLEQRSHMSFVDKSNFDLVWCTMLDPFLGQGGARSFHDAHTDFRGNGLGTGHEVRHVVPWFSVRDRDGHAPVGT